MAAVVSAWNPFGDRRRVQRAAVLPREHPSRVCPRRPPLQSTCELPPSVGSQDRYCAGVDCDGALASVTLGRTFNDFPADLDELRSDGQAGGVQVDVGPAEPARFPPTQPTMRNEVEHGVQRVRFGGVEEGAELRRCPHHHRGWWLCRGLQLLDNGRLRTVAYGSLQPQDGLLPALHPLGRPHQCTRTLSTGKFHQRSGIDRDQPLPQCVGQRDAQGRAHPLSIRVRRCDLG